MNCLKDLRKTRNVTQVKVANYLGITRGAYTNIENGVVSLTPLLYANWQTTLVLLPTISSGEAMSPSPQKISPSPMAMSWIESLLI